MYIGNSQIYLCVNNNTIRQYEVITYSVSVIYHVSPYLIHVTHTAKPFTYLLLIYIVCSSKGHCVYLSHPV